MMSGTSMDGIDLGLVLTDGEEVYGFGPRLSVAYGEDFRGRLRSVLGQGADLAVVSEVERELTMKHAQAVAEFMRTEDFDAGSIGVIGFHGHTVLHRPKDQISRQIGDGRLLAAETGVQVVSDFRSADIANGGQGAPLAPLFHAVIAADMPKPLAVLNIGGIANVTWLGENGEIVAFDTGPGNALIDDWVLNATGRPFDGDGQLAGQGTVKAEVLEALVANRYFARPVPKTLDRGDFSEALNKVEGLSPADGAATLTAFSASAAAHAQEWFPGPPLMWLVTGGGRHNRTLMTMLGEAVDAALAPVETVGWDGDFLEAQAFAYLAVRSLRGLPLSLPGTTGVAEPTTGGVLNRP